MVGFMDDLAGKTFCRRCNAWVEVAHQHSPSGRVQLGRLSSANLVNSRERVRGRLQVVNRERWLDGERVRDGDRLELLLAAGNWVVGSIRGGDNSTPTLEIELGGSWESSHGREEPVTAFITLPGDATLRWSQVRDLAEGSFDGAAGREDDDDRD